MTRQPTGPVAGATDDQPAIATARRNNGCLIGHFPHVESPTAVVKILDDFIATTDRSDKSKNLISTVAQRASTCHSLSGCVARSYEAA